MTHQALITYRALLDAAAVAHYPGHTEWAERPTVQGYERNQWDYRPCEDGSPAFVTVPTGERSTMRIANNKARLEHMADQVQPLPKPPQSTPAFRPVLSHWRNTQHARRRPAAGHSGPIRQPLQGAARTMAAGLGRPWAGLQQASTGPGKHGPGHGPGPAAGAGQGPGSSPGQGLHGPRAGAAPPPRAPGARLVQGPAAPGPGAPGRAPTCSRGPGWRAQAPPLGVAASADGVRAPTPLGVAASADVRQHGPPRPFHFLARSFDLCTHRHTNRSKT